MEINASNTVWLLVSSALVLLMTPGLALFYGGLNRSKGTLNMMMMSFGSIGLISLLWMLYGFSLAFGINASDGAYTFEGAKKSSDELRSASLRAFSTGFSR